MEQFLKYIAEYGLASVGLVTVTLFLAWLIKNIMASNKERETIYVKFMQEDLKNISAHMQSLADIVNTFAITVNDAHKYQREEHIKMINNLDSMCVSLVQHNLVMENHAKNIISECIDRKKEHEMMVDCLNDIKEAIIRINGYKHV